MWAQEATQGTKSHKLGCLVWWIGGTNRDKKEERDVLRDFSRNKPNPRSIYKKSYRHHVSIDNDVYERWSIGDLTCNQSFLKNIFNFNEIPFFDEFIN